MNQVVVPNGPTLQFAFWSITGGAGAPPIVSTHPVPPSVTVGTTGDIVGTAWYFDISGGGPGSGSEVDIDAFNESTGEFVLDNFVTIQPDASLSAEANLNGDVSNTNAENIVAFQDLPQTPPALPVDYPVFDDWMIISDDNPTDLQKKLNIAGGTLVTQKNSSGLAFALYELQCDTSISATSNPLIFDGHAHTADAGGNPLTLNISTSQVYCKWSLFFMSAAPLGAPPSAPPNFVTLGSTSGTGSSTVTYSLNENTTGKKRAVRVCTSLGHYVTIIQQPLVCQYALSVGPPYPATIEAPGKNETVLIEVFTSPDCYWTASVVPGAARPIALHVASLLPPGSMPANTGLGNGTVSFGLAGNGNPDPKAKMFICKLIIAGHEVQVYQMGHGPFGPIKPKQP